MDTACSYLFLSLLFPSIFRTNRRSLESLCFFPSSLSDASKLTTGQNGALKGPGFSKELFFLRCHFQVVPPLWMLCSTYYPLMFNICSMYVPYIYTIFHVCSLYIYTHIYIITQLLSRCFSNICMIYCIHVFCIYFLQHWLFM